MPEHRPGFRGGRNIALKTPAHQYQSSIAFYRDVLGLRHLKSLERSELFEFGDLRLWVDRVDGLSQAEVWLEVVTDDTAAAAAYLERNAVVRADAIEPLPDGFDGFWIISPAAIVHLMAGPSAAPSVEEA